MYKQCFSINIAASEIFSENNSESVIQTPGDWVWEQDCLPLRYAGAIKYTFAQILHLL